MKDLQVCPYLLPARDKLVLYGSFLICNRFNVTRFAKTQHNSAFMEIHFTVPLRMFWALKTFFCSSIKSVLQTNSQLQAMKARDAIRGFV